MNYKINEINKKTNEKQLINFLETAISDEVILSSFIRNLKIVEFSKDRVLICLENKFAENYIIVNHINDINRAVEEVFQTPTLKVEITYKDKYNQIDVPETNNSVEKKQEIINEIKTNINSKFTINNYVEGEFNKEAFSAAKEIIREAGSFTPLFIYSNSGMGKTHLLHAIGNEVAKKQKKAVYIGANKFTSEVVRAIKLGGDEVEKLTNHYESFDYLMFDDIQNLGDRSATLKILFNIINEYFQDDNKQIIFASDKTPNELGGFEDRFITRFEKGLTLEIKKPTIDDLITVLKRKIMEDNLSIKN
jgi:chromosomal replication initiator protein